MKQILIIVVTLMFLLGACGTKTVEDAVPLAAEPVKEQVQEVVPPVPEPTTPVQLPKEQVQEQPPQVIQEPEQEEVYPEEVVEEEEVSPAPVVKPLIPESPTKMSPELRDLLSNADQKVKSYKYMYSISKDNRYPHTYFVKGNYIKVKLFEVDPYYIENYYDTVYLDAKTKSGRGFCESKSRCAIRDVDNTERVFNVSYTDYRVRTPYEFLREITHAEIIGPELIENRQTVKVRQYDGTIMTDFWLDANYGMPRRIVVTKDDTVLTAYNFADMTFNALSDSDVWREVKKE